MSELRCVHRHDIKSHPNCFKKGLIKYNWWESKKIGFLDIETSGLKANFDFMLSWCIKPLGNNKVAYGIIEKKEIFDGVFDKRLVTELLQEMDKYDIIVTYYGTNFDIPFCRSRADYYKLGFFKFGEKCHWDLYFHVKRLYATHRKSLKVITHFLGIQGKTEIDFDVWLRARFGDTKSLAEVLDHNKYDVIILEKLYERIKDYSKWIRKPM